LSEERRFSKKQKKVVPRPLLGGDGMAGAMGNFSKTKESCLPSLIKHPLPVHGSLVGRAFAT
jgi:hypothetical protein